MTNGNGLGRIPLYFLGVLAAAVLSLGAYVWTQTQQEIAAQRMVDDITQKRIELLQHDLDKQFHTLNQQVILDQERLRAMTEILTRFRTSYDRVDTETAERFQRQYQLIMDTKQALQSISERLRHLEGTRGVPREERTP
jgi:hypothetical protein